MLKSSGLGKTVLALFLSACCVSPAPVSAAGAAAAAKPRVRTARHRYVPREKAVDPTLGDITNFDDPIVRAAAVDALGKYNGSVVAVEPTTGRILAVVNQKMAYSAGAIPCSTIKLVTSLAALTDNIVNKNTSIYTSRYVSYNMTQALARLIQDPSGCFEQTSSTSYPLTMAQQYFLGHTGVDPKLIASAQEKLDAGYKRLVGFETSERGYEWFGENPGHEALTAYGLLHFSDMAKVRPVDQAFRGTPTGAAPVDQGVAAIAVRGLAAGHYHWQARLTSAGCGPSVAPTSSGGAGGSRRGPPRVQSGDGREHRRGDRP